MTVIATTLTEFLRNFDKYNITNVTDDTKNVKKGSLFVAIKGENFDGQKAIPEMFEKGAVAVITEKESDFELTKSPSDSFMRRQDFVSGVISSENQIIVQNARASFAAAAARFYGNPTSKLKLIAVTGTNGKTTTASLIKFILEKNGHKTGFIGTTCYDVCNADGSVYESKLSTPRQDELYRLFSEMVANNAEYCVMEASSQALSQFRITGEIFETGIFTNLTQDHLDWHKTMENYYQAKKSLFDMCKRAVICIDDKYGRRLTREINIPFITYSINESAVQTSDNDNSLLLSDFYGVNIKSSSAGVSYWLNDVKAEKAFPFKFRMPGMFSVANTIAATAACTSVGIKAEDCISALEDCAGVRGRCEVIYSGDFTVICDYAHTEDALVKILTCVREFAKRRIICLFGAAGERDADKRSAMGTVTAKYSDYIIITSDNPRFEEPEKIIAEVKKGIPKNAPPCETFSDRKKAIEFALSIAEKDDIVLLCGKGHETYQVIGDDYQPFDEREIVINFLD